MGVSPPVTGIKTGCVTVGVIVDKVGVFEGHHIVAVAVGVGVGSCGGLCVAVGVGGTCVSVGVEVGVFVGSGVAVGGTGVSVGKGVAVALFDGAAEGAQHACWVHCPLPK